jgi:uncharacterized protein YlaI
MEGGRNYLRTIEGQTIPFTSTPGNLGGFRFWFLCPECGKRVAVLYRIGYYLCKDCHSLSYSSRRWHKTKFEQLWKDARVRQRLLKIIDGIGQKGLSKVERLQLQKLCKKSALARKYLPEGLWK